jgi:hypothetical protein
MIATKEHIISVIRSVAKELGRAPTSYELRRKGGISPALVKHRFGNYMAVLRAAGLEPRNTGTRLADAQLLEDWGRVVRKRKQVPSGSQYMLAGKFSLGSFIRRFQSWRLVPAAFVLAAEQSALGGDWNDVVETVRKGPIPVSGGGWWQNAARQAGKPATAEQAPEGAKAKPLLPALMGKKCVTATMLAVLFASVTAAGFVRRALPDRPVLGAPINLPGLAHEPVNEMGVSMLFAMLADRLGFIIESVQAAFPDCRAKMEIAPGRWQWVSIEFEYESRSFKRHGHDPRGCDVIVCWRHNWKGCPAELQVLELSKVIG